MEDAIKGQPKWINPFAAFLNDAYSEFQKIPREPEVRSDPTLHASFVKLHEERGFVFDVVHRVETLATALDRMQELSNAYLSCERQRDNIIEVQRAADASRVVFEVPDDLIHECDQYKREACVLTTFLYYEMSTIVLLAGNWLAIPPTSALGYLIGVRNKFLVHPRRDGRIKNSRSAMTISPILHVHLLGAEMWNPLVKDWYLTNLDPSWAALDEEARGKKEDAGIAANIALIRGDKWVDKFDPKEILRLQAYSIPEPDLLASATEMAVGLSSGFLREVHRVCTDRARRSI